MSKDNGGPASDRELLEMAAKAAGIDLRWKLGVHQITLPPALPYYLVGGLDQYWNPLTDDGDALRLACFLGLILETGLNDGRSSSACDVSCSHHFYLEDHDGDICAGARRAIVMCAAEIGKSM